MRHVVGQSAVAAAVAVERIGRNAPRFSALLVIILGQNESHGSTFHFNFFFELSLMQIGGNKNN